MWAVASRRGSISSAEGTAAASVRVALVGGNHHAELGDKEKAFLWLEKAYQGPEHDLAFARAWPMFDGLRSDPRYQELIRRVGLPE